MPGREGFCDHDVETLGLLNYSCEERYGLIWVRLSPNGGHTESSWDEWFAPLNDELHALGIDSHSVFSTRDVVVKANWKVVNDAFMEGYHFRFVHKDSVFPFYCDNQGVFTSLGPHYRYFLADRNMNAQADVPREQRRLRENCLMVYQIFPVSSVQVLADHLFVHSLLPIGQGETLIRNTMLVPQLPESEKQEQYWKTNLEIVQRALDEDHDAAERVQRGIASGDNPDLLFGRYEQGIVHMHDHFNDALDGKLRFD